MKNQRLGDYRVDKIAGESVRAFIPPTLPPKPPLEVVPLMTLLAEANTGVGRLDGVARVLPDTPLFLYMYVRKEAVLSSQIEGTQSSLNDLLLFENDAAPGVPLDDVEEVSHYVAAMSHGLKRLNEQFPMSLRLIKEIHEILLSGSRGSTKNPGEFRRSQNWIGGSRPGNAIFVPPPPDLVGDLMGQFELFLHDESPEIPPLIHAAIAHVQFETIHPFLDGNGRLGRLLITLLLCSRGVLEQPTLYLSLYLKANRSTYYALLQEVRERGNWEDWIEFFLEGVKTTSEQAANSAVEILKLFEADRKRLETLGRAQPSAVLVYEYLQKKPVVNARSVQMEVTLSRPTILKMLNSLVDLGILRRNDDRKRDQLFVYTDYIALLNEGTDVADNVPVANP